ncbi:GNAT family N-acetyltransferase [Halomonas ramblicola]|uniref:GNAT family N-acetyltransferase n=1 Tax=Halomonas ramblicola TaxID=747349 RepID=UPI0025B60593|nr:N-acetyltransferase [Halomonas ramblicola]MDN3523636.1 N-acetyltransferase [Halomonas ramblicola]
MRALREAGALSVSLVAESDGEVVGHVAASKVTLSDGTPDWFGLGPVSVLPAWQGRGIGSALVQECLARLRERGARGCVVLGEPDYYQRFGFRAVPGLILPGVPLAYFMALDWGDDRPRAEVAFHPAFTATA